ncbi:PKD repeat-containing protein [Candidatus Methanomarinus sp.]|nr:PKD repeat-containing protein [ANME-2 cluster archaeon]
MNECGHDGVYLWRVSNANIYNNTVTPRTNTGIRATESNHISIYNNTISPGIATGGSGILIQKARANPVMDDIEIYNNIINGSNLCGIHLIGYNAYTKDQAKDVHIHRNIITGVGRSAGSMWNVAGIAIQGFHNTTIENNVIDGCYMDGIATNFYITGAPESGYVTIVRNNIVTNTHERLYDATGTGNGIANHLSDTHSFVLENNDVWNNVNENYYKTAAGLDDVQVNPLFADISNHDYHLKSAAGRWSGNSWISDDVTSPLIDAGHPKSDYSNEPAPIVGRINIGRYGNTAEASKSVSDQPITSAGIDQTVTTGDTVTLDGSASTDDVGITSYVWDFDDSNGLQQDATGAAVQHTYNMAGTYTATLTVTDGDGNADFDTVAITVNERFITPKPNETISSTYDNRLREASPDLVLYYNDYIDIGHNTDVGRYRDVMWFNLSMYNTTDTISTATLSLYWYYPEDSTRNKDTVVEIYRPVDWDPDYVNWNSRTSDTPWNTPGGDWFDMNEVAWGSVSYASVTFTGTDVPDNRFYEFDVTELVQDYISGKYGNTGFFLKAQDEYDNYISFYSSDYSNADQRPKLTVTQNHALV